MAVLKKVKASTLMETLVATVLLVVIFMVTSLVINNLFSNTITYNTRPVITYLNELEYSYQHQQLPLPYTRVYDDWEITISNVNKNAIACTIFKATHRESSKTITKTIITNAKKQ